jgi:plastocyanin
MPLRTRHLTPLATLLLALVGSTSGALHPPHVQHSDTSVEIRTFQFAPDTIAVKTGTRIRWINQDEIEHTVTAGTPEKRDTRFDGTLETKGATFEAGFDRPGTFTYFCDRHQFMRGTITVSGK